MVYQYNKLKCRVIFYQIEDPKRQIKKSKRLLEKIFKKDLGFKELFYEELFKMPDPEKFLRDFLRDYRILKDEIKTALFSREFDFQDRV